MKRFLPLFFFLIYFSAAAQQTGIHQEQSEYYQQYSHFSEQQFDSLNGRLLHFKKEVYTPLPLACNLNKIVFGWFPYWQGTTYNNFQWDKLSDLSFFSYDVDPATGNASSTHGWSTANVVTVAQQNGVRVNLCVTLFSSHATFFGSSAAQQTLISNLISLIQQRNANGVNIDFEGVPSSQKTAFTNFMIDLCNQMHAAIPGSQVSMALYSVDWNGVFDMPALNPYVDLFIIMGYDYYYGGSTTAGPNDPLYHFGTTYNYTLSKSISFYLNKGVSPNKLILGLPYYGREYTTTSNSVPSSVLNPPNSATRTFTTVKLNTGGNYINSNKYWNADSYSPYWMFQSGGNWKQCFVDDAYSMRKRFDMVNQQGIGGIGIWALGYDDGYPDYWDAISDKFTDCGTIPCVDTIYDGGGPNKNYYDNENYTHTIAPAGASSVSLIFSSFDVETNFDTLWIYDGPNTSSPLIGAYTGTNSPGTVNSTGSTLTYRFKSDVSTTRPGWSAIWNCTTVPIDNTNPTTLAAISGNWQTQNFIAAFTDADNVSVAERFYQVMDWNGTAWRGSSANGFFNDNFDNAIHPEWNPAGGTWAISSAYLNQADEANSNTNIYTSVNQTSSFTYLYNWQMKMGGSGTNRRAGLHFFSDNSTLPNRGNGYFVYFRVDNQKAQIYKVVNDTFYLKTDIAYSFAANTFYDFKTSFDPSAGLIKIYVNDSIISAWTDPSPISNGNSISLRTGNCTSDFNNLKIYRSRNITETVTVGNSSAYVRYQNPSPATPSCRIKSLVVDGAENWSSASTLNVNIDWTKPAAVLVKDGPFNDIDTSNINTELSANWTASVDTHSAITTYLYAIGTSAGDSDVVNWVDYGNNISVTRTGLSLNYGSTYYFSVIAVNGAGLMSNAINSDGQILLQPIPPPTANFTTANNSVCSGEMINFQNTSVDADSFAWYFPGGNPTTSILSNPAIAYDSSGSFSVTLIAYSTGNTSDTLTQTISVTVNPLPLASFSSDLTNAFLPEATVNFVNSSANSDSFQWFFGDDSSSIQQNPAHTYNDSGYYSVSLIAGNSLCGYDTVMMTNYIHVMDTTVIYPSPAAAFSTSATIVCTGDYISFINNSTNAGSYQWTFNGGTPSSSTLENPSIIYDSSGTYGITLIASGQGGTDTIYQSVSVTVNLTPFADFDADQTIVYMPDATVNFINNSSDATEFSWNFGDGTTSNDTNPLHTFADTGYYTVSLIAMNGNCPDDMLSISNYIYVSDTTTSVPLPVAAFTAAPTFICEGDVISFINSSTNSTSYEWSFPGGIPSASSDANPLISFDSSGMYSVSLIASGPGGNDTVSQIINVTVNPSPVAGFTANSTTVYLPNASVNFTNSSIDATSFQWDFGDGSTSFLQDPVHIYTDSGLFSVTLICSNGLCEDDTLVFADFISVLDTASPVPAPIADFTYSTANICMGESISFMNSSINTDSHQWNFGGGTTDTTSEVNPIITFDSSGTYTISLIASGPGGKDTMTQVVNITVMPLPKSIFSANVTTVYIPNATVNFLNSSTDASSFEWSFGDGTTSASQDPVHTYTDTGLYSITLISSNGLCKNDTITAADYIYVLDTATVIDSPIAAFTTSSANICENENISFINNSSNAISFEWFFSGGSPSNSTLQNPSVSYDSSGAYSVILVASGPGGTDTLQQTQVIIVNPAPVAAFAATDTIVYLPGAFVAFTNYSSNASAYLWDFGDGDSSVAISPWHNYNDSGFFSISLISYGNNCPHDTLIMENYIFVGGPLGEQEMRNSELDFIIRPNPNSGTFIFSSSANSDTRINIYNVLGEIVFQDVIIIPNSGDRELEINISKQPVGIYFLQAISANNNQTLKLIIE